MINHKELNVESVYKDQKFFNETNIIEDLIFWNERLNIDGKKILYVVLALHIDISLLLNYCIPCG